MTTDRNTSFCLLKKSNGFSLVELMVVIVMLSVLSTIAIVNYVPLKRQARDTMALSDARNLVDGIIEAALSGEDVDYNLDHLGGVVGGLDNGGIPRAPVYVLSPGVKAKIIGSSNAIGGTMADVTAYVYHDEGTPDGFSVTGCGRKEFVVTINEATGFYSLP